MDLDVPIVPKFGCPSENMLGGAPLVECGFLKEDLELARRSVLEGWSCALARNGVLIDKEKGKGVLPIMSLVQRTKMRKVGEAPTAGCVLADKVLGLAAFKAGALLGARIMWGYMASALAVEEGYRRGIPVLFHRLVPAILRKTGEDLCPMEHLSFISESDWAFYQAFWSTAKTA